MIVVADAANVCVRLREETQPQILRHVGVLILVDQHVAEALLIALQHVGMILEQPQVLHQKVAEIDGVQILEAALIGGIERAPLAVGKAVALAVGHTLGPQTAVLPAVDHAGEDARGPALLVDILCFEKLLDQTDLVVRIEHGEGGLEVDKLRVAAEDFHADGVKRAEPRHAFNNAADQATHPLLHLARGLVGEGHRQDLPWIGAPKAQQMRNARGQHPRLARSRAGEHQQWPVQRLHCLALLGVERVQIRLGITPHGTLRNGEHFGRRRPMRVLGFDIRRQGRGSGACANLGHVLGL